MNSPPVPTPEMRKRVAEALFPKHTFANHEWFVQDGGVFSKTGYRSFVVFDPQYYPQQKDALIRKVAQLIEAISLRNHYDTINAKTMLSARLRIALATNNTSALESLCFELMEKSE